MDGVIRFYSFAVYALELLPFYWPALVLVVLGVLGASEVARRDSAAQLRVPLLWSLLQLIVPQ